MPDCSPTPASPSISRRSTNSASRPFELVVVNLYPFTADRRLRRRRGRVRRADRHRWAVDGARGRQEPSERRGGRRPAGLRRRAGSGPGRRVHARGAKEVGVVGIPAHRRIRRRGRVVDGVGTGARTELRRRAARHGSGRRCSAQPCCGTARTRTSRPRSSPTTAHGRGSRRPSSFTEKRCPTTTTPMPTPRGVRRSTTRNLVAIIKHANPCGIAVSSVSVADAHRKAHECDPLSAFGGVIAANTEVSVEMAETVAGIFTEVIIAPAYEPERWKSFRARRTSACWSRPSRSAGGTEFRQISGGLLLQQRDALDAAGDDPPTGRWRPAHRPTPRRWPTWCSRGARAARSSPTRSSSPRTAPPSASAWVRSTGSTPRRLAVERAGDRARARSPHPTRSSRSRTGSRR